MKKARKYSRGPWQVAPFPRGTVAGCREIGWKSGANRQAQIRPVACTAGLADDVTDHGNAVLLASAPRLLAFARLLAGYGCAGEPACDGVEKCGVCEAEAFLRETGLDAARATPVEDVPDEA